jgi:hypothetical protein
MYRTRRNAATRRLGRAGAVALADQAVGIIDLGHGQACVRPSMIAKNQREIEADALKTTRWPWW